MKFSRQDKLEIFAGDGDLEIFKEELGSRFTQLELDVSLENAIAYSQIHIAEYLIELGADISNYDYQGVYYAVHNNEIAGLKFSISQGVDIDFSNGSLLNTSIVTSINAKECTITKWLIDNGANKDLLSSASMKRIDEYGSDELKGLFQ